MLLRFPLGLTAVLLLLLSETATAQMLPNFIANARSLAGPVTHPLETQTDEPSQVFDSPQAANLSQALALNLPALRQGRQVVINGIRLQLPWIQAQGLVFAQGENLPTGEAVDPSMASPDTASPGSAGVTPPGPILVSDVALRSLGGIDFLDTDNPYQQPILWRGNPLQAQGVRLVLPAQLSAQQRYLDITPLIQQAQWRVTIAGDNLTIQTSALQAARLALPLGQAFVPQTIQWSPYLQWKQAYERLGGAQFPVTQLRVNLEPGVVALRPIWSDDSGLVGIDRLAQTVASHQATAAINGGFFNRNNKTPLGAIRQNGEWISGPILNRGAIAGTR
ncbi:MAG: phosphodiester glycosidase family protein, partial [Synechococcales cyanobacterium RM1_1_8]|nr:phosphodiester glycosidase family protein [Synechococcales cyanobacterium RM1_1_8]